MTDAEKLKAIEQALAPLAHYLNSNTAAMPQSSLMFAKMLEALKGVSTVMTVPMVAVTVKELEELRQFRADRTPPPAPVRG
jgi:hypothetical protein